MSREELFAVAFAPVANFKVRPFHKAMMEECCEVAISSNPGMSDVKELAEPVRIAFLVANDALKATFAGLLKENPADQITLNYRGQEFVFRTDDPFLN